MLCKIPGAQARHRERRRTGVNSAAAQAADNTHNDSRRAALHAAEACCKYEHRQHAQRFRHREQTADLNFAESADNSACKKSKRNRFFGGKAAPDVKRKHKRNGD